MRIDINKLTGLNVNTFQQHFDSHDTYKYELDPNYLFLNIVKSAQSFEIRLEGSYAVLIKEFAGASFHCLFIIKGESLILRELGCILSMLREQCIHLPEEKIVLKNLSEEGYYTLITQGEIEGFQFISIETAYILHERLYPFESNFPQVIIKIPEPRVDPLDSIDVRPAMSLPAMSGPGSGRLRYEIKRVLKKFDLSVKDVYIEHEFLVLLNEWRKNIETAHLKDGSFIVAGRRFSNTDFENFWIKPMMEFPKIMKEGLMGTKLEYRYVFTNGLDTKGVWAGKIWGDCMMIYLFLTNRFVSLFADALLFDIIAYCYRHSIKWVNLGGAEQLSLYAFKRKYVKYFNGSFEHKTYDLMVL